MLAAMNTMRKIQIDEATAIALEQRAADRGVSVADLVAELAEHAVEPIEVSDEELAELDRIAAAADEPGGTVPHDEVVRWLETWGTPAYKPWSSR
jgi:predicted transcriptional regulator